MRNLREHLHIPPQMADVQGRRGHFGEFLSGAHPWEFRGRYSIGSEYGRKHEQRNAIKAKQGTTTMAHRQGRGQGRGHSAWGVLRDTFGREFGEYLRNPYVHGLKYLVRSDYSLAVRLVWGLLVATALAGIVGLVVEQDAMYTGGSVGATYTSIVDTRVDITKFPFPAVTVCPQSTIVKGNALNFLRGHVNDSATPHDNKTREILIQRVMKALEGFHFPIYLDKWTDIAPEDYNIFSPFDMSEFYFRVTVTCHQLFMSCSLNDVAFDCCDKFQRQETESGVCYSFNSCVSLDRKNSPCDVMRGSPESSAGLKFITATTPDAQVLYKDSLRRGIRVIISSPYDVPNGADAIQVLEEHTNVLSIAYTLTVQNADPDIRSVPWRSRDCKFYDEDTLDICSTYSQSACLVSCRLRAVAEMCGCVPFTFSIIEGSPIAEYPVCDLAGMVCIIQKNSVLRQVNNVATEDEFRPGLDKMGPYLGVDCECPSECQLLLYDSEENIVGNARGIGASVAIYGRGVPSVNILYHKRLTSSLPYFLANLGNVVALFLGISILSVLEFLFVCVSAIMGTCKQLKRANVTKE